MSIQSESTTLQNPHLPKTLAMLTAFLLYLYFDRSEYLLAISLHREKPKINLSEGLLEEGAARAGRDPPWED